MKETLVKALAAIICVVILCVSISGAVESYVTAEKDVAEYKASMVQAGGSSNGGLMGGSGDMGGSTGDLGGSGDMGGSTGDMGGSTGDMGGSTGDATVPGDATGDAGNAGNTGDAGNAGAQQPAKLTKADVIKFFNAETAKAAKGSYKLTRTGKFIKPIDVGSLTDALNKIITGVDKNANLDSVVGGFLGIKKDPIKGDVKNGKGEGFDAKYMIKAMALTEADVVDFAVNGNTYKIKVKDCVTPDAKSAIAHATNDYITFAEVNKGISDSVGNAVRVVPEESEAKYSNIIFTATVVDGKITTLEYSYTLDASLKIKLAIPSAMGTGQATISGKYTEIKY